MKRTELLQELPSNFVEDLKLRDDLLELIVKQYKLLQEYNKDEYVSYYSVNLTEDGKLFLPEGTLIHGVRRKATKEYLESVKKYGLLGAEFLGEVEDLETFYCLDFYRVENDYSMEDYYNWYTSMETTGILKKKKPEFNFLPHYNEFVDSETIAFVVNNNPIFYNFLQYDYYRENETFPVMQQIANVGTVEKFKENMQDRLSCVLVGVPSTAISGILVTAKLAQNEEFINNLKREFPNSYIALVKDGTMVYMPPYITILENRKITL